MQLHDQTGVIKPALLPGLSTLQHFIWRLRLNSHKTSKIKKHELLFGKGNYSVKQFSAVLSAKKMNLQLFGQSVN